MKKVISALAAVVALAACSNEETLYTPQPEIIGFGQPFIENSTRATDPSYSGNNKLTEFYVWGTANGVAIYDGNKVTGEVGENSVWTCTKKNYWIEGVKYKFAAVAGGTVKTLSNGLPATIEYTANGANDLVYAKNFGDDGNGIVGQAAGANEAVPFIFNHLLAKAKFTVSTNTNVEGYSYEITNIKVDNAYASGVYDVADEKWGTLVAAENGQAFDDVTVNATTKTAECANEKLLIPVEDVEVSYTVTLKYNGGTIWSESKSHTLSSDLAAANSYNFKITVNVGEEITFNVENDPSWTTTADNTITL